MRTTIESIGDLVIAVTWPLLFGMAILAIACGRMLGLGEREESSASSEA